MGIISTIKQNAQNAANVKNELDRFKSIFTVNQSERQTPQTGQIKIGGGVKFVAEHIEDGVTSPEQVIYIFIGDLDDIRNQNLPYIFRYDIDRDDYGYLYVLNNYNPSEAGGVSKVYFNTGTAFEPVKGTEITDNMIIRLNLTHTEVEEEENTVYSYVYNVPGWIELPIAASTLNRATIEEILCEKNLNAVGAVTQFDICRRSILYNDPPTQAIAFDDYKIYEEDGTASQKTFTVNSLGLVFANIFQKNVGGYLKTDDIITNYNTSLETAANQFNTNKDLFGLYGLALSYKFSNGEIILENAFSIITEIPWTFNSFNSIYLTNDGYINATKYMEEHYQTNLGNNYTQSDQTILAYCAIDCTKDFATLFYSDKTPVFVPDSTNANNGIIYANLFGANTLVSGSFTQTQCHIVVSLGSNINSFTDTKCANTIALETGIATSNWSYLGSIAIMTIGTQNLHPTPPFLAQTQFSTGLGSLINDILKSISIININSNLSSNTTEISAISGDITTISGYLGHISDTARTGGAYCSLEDHFDANNNPYLGLYNFQNNTITTQTDVTNSVTNLRDLIVRNKTNNYAVEYVAMPVTDNQRGIGHSIDVINPTSNNPYYQLYDWTTSNIYSIYMTTYKDDFPGLTDTTRTQGGPVFLIRDNGTLKYGQIDFSVLATKLVEFERRITALEGN